MHDAIYDPHAHDNEERSADWCRSLIASAGIIQKIGDRPYACILSTRHRHLPERPDERLTVSLDLSILGETPALYRRYDRAIRKEYSWVPLDIYRRERARVLRTFLDQSTIFPLPWFEQRLGHQARFNLQQSIRCL